MFKELPPGIVLKTTKQNPKGVIYIAGPMSGLPRYNFDAFYEAEAKLIADGWDVINPARVDEMLGFDPDKDKADAIFMDAARKRDIQMIVEEADAIFMLPGWSRSRGAKAERAIAIWCGHTAYQLHDGAIVRMDELATEPWMDYSEKVVTSACNFFEVLDDFKHEEDVLEEALRITKGDRQNQYGPVDQDFARTAAMWSALFGWEVKPWMVAAAMICLKLSRETHQHKRDNLVDAAGYARLVWLCKEAEVEDDNS